MDRMKIKQPSHLLGAIGLLACGLSFHSFAFAETFPMHPSQNNSPSASIAAKNLEVGQNFLAANQKKPKVQVLPSGLQYLVLQEGSGTPPGLTDFVTVHYRGTLIDGAEFDSSYRHNTAVTFAVNAVIPGWTEALQLMKPGAKWTVYIPPQLAYGSRGVGRLIGPNATLVFDIELVSVKPAVDDTQDYNDDFEDGG
jgi:FKBP-type peptidyl-prolyl cis-trans isomerase FklB